MILPEAHEVAINPLAPFASQDKPGPEAASIGSDEQQPLIGEASVPAMGPIPSSENSLADAYLYARSYAKDAMDAGGISPERQAEILESADLLSHGDSQAFENFNAAVTEAQQHSEVSSQDILQEFEQHLATVGITAGSAVVFLPVAVKLLQEKQSRKTLVGVAALLVVAACNGAFPALTPQFSTETTAHPTSVSPDTTATEVQATATIGAVPVTQVEASATPDTYGVEVGHSEKAEVEVLGVKVNLELVTDTSLQNRANKPIQEVLFNGAYENPAGPDVDTAKAKESVAEGVMRGVWHAWKNNDTTRESVSFEAYMQMVADYQAGTRPLSDVAYTVFANDLTTPDYSTELTTFDPTKPVRIVFTANRANMTTYEVSNIKDDIAFGTQRNANGELELWIHPSWDVGERKSSTLTERLAVALMRLTWPGSQGTDTTYSRDLGEPDTYHPDIKKAMTYIYTFQVSGSSVEIGDIKPDKASTDFHNH